MFQDEARFGRISDRRRCWGPWPQRPIVAGQVVREFLYACVAVSPLDGQMSSLVLPWMTAQTMSQFLAHTSAMFPCDHCILFLDQAGWHIARELRTPPNLQLELLPPWSPELNPVESIWDYLRDHYTGNRVFRSLSEVEASVCAGLSALHRAPDQVRSITGYRWINTLSQMSK